MKYDVSTGAHTLIMKHHSDAYRRVKYQGTRMLNRVRACATR